MMTYWFIYLDTDKTVLQQMELLAPIMQQWTGVNYEYLAVFDNRFQTSVLKNPKFSLEASITYLKSKDDLDRFRYVFSCNDYEEELSMEAHIGFMKDLLELLWKNNIPAIASTDFAEMLPYKGGTEGPLPLPG